jgi:APA family basic amino acid/polyamine antiporter
MAMTFASYAAPSWRRPVALAAVAATTALNVLGIKKTAVATRVIVAVVLGTLAVSVIAMLGGGQVELARLRPIEGVSTLGVVHGAAIMFFAFAGYARIATLGEEVVEPERTIPVAIATSFAVAVAVYAVVAVAALVSLDVAVLAASSAPLADAVAAGSLSALAPAVRMGATVACFGVLLSLQAGVGRTVFAMAAEADLPRWLGAVDEKRGVPRRAEIAVAVAAAALVLATDVAGAIGFSSFAVLLYYAVTNAAALRLGPGEHPPPRWLAILGLAGCITLAFAVPTAIAR